MKHILFLILLVQFQLNFAQYCDNETRFSEQDYFSFSETDSVTNIQFAEAENYLNEMQTLAMDLYFPKKSVDELSKKPLILMIHGGGFYSGTKDYEKIECIKLAQSGFVTATISYRLNWDNDNPLGILKAIYRAQQDAQAALRYLVNNAETYEIDTNWIFIGGGSAGAITSNNVVYTNQTEWNLIYPGISALEGDLNNSGNNLTDEYTIKGVFNNWGAVPLNVVSVDELLPQIAFHGELDDVVGIDTLDNLMGSRSIHKVLEENNICSDLTVEPTGGHGIYVDLDGNNFRAKKTSCFFKSIICDNCSGVYTTERIDPNCSVTSSSNQLLSTQLNAFPNPTNGILNIEAPLNGEIKLMDVSGKLVKNIKAIELTVIDLTDLKPGIYILNYLNNTISSSTLIEKI